jgi:hypothetical protein
MSQDHQQSVEIIAPAGQAQDSRSASAKLLERYQKRFEPGQSGNPGGRPKLRLLSKAAREALAEVNPETGLSNAEEIVAALVKKAKSGDVWACRELREWTEGRVPTVLLADINHTDSSDMSRIKTLLMQKLIRHEELPERQKESHNNEQRPL